MFWWILAGIVLFGTVLLALSAVPAARRVPGLMAARARAQALATEAETTRQAVDDLRARMAELTEHAQQVEEHTDRVKRRFSAVVRGDGARPPGLPPVGRPGQAGQGR